MARGLLQQPGKLLFSWHDLNHVGRDDNVIAWIITRFG